MAFAKSAAGRWQQMTGIRQGFITRCEDFAAYTLPKICLPEHQSDTNRDLAQDFQSVGAQAVNFLANKLILALFAPSRPFFRLEPSMEVKAEIATAGAPQDEVDKMLASAEREAIKQLDKLAIRPKLYEAFKHLIITGNVGVIMDGEDIFRVVGLKKYAVRRSCSGAVLEMIFADKMIFDELDEDAKDFLRDKLSPKDDHKVTLYRWIRRDPKGDYRMEQWVEGHKLPDKFDGKWPWDKCPYRPLTWDLADGMDYGTGLVEDYENDFAGLSALSRSQVQGAILASEFRWLVNPAGMTKPEDFENTPNGGALPGQEGDITLVESGKAGDLQITLNMATEYVNRLGRAFLMGSTMVRQAERVTAEEIRLIANELETALGGAYSRLAVDFQIPMAVWLLSLIKVQTGKKSFEPIIVTGLDALSRSGDLEELKLWLSDVAAITALPPQSQAELNLGPLFNALGTARRIDVSAYLKTPDQKAAELQQAQQMQMEQASMQAGVDVAAESAIQANSQEG